MWGTVGLSLARYAGVQCAAAMGPTACQEFPQGRTMDTVTVVVVKLSVHLNKQILPRSHDFVWFGGTGGEQRQSGATTISSARLSKTFDRNVTCH